MALLDIKSLSHYSEWKTDAYDDDDRDIDFVCLAADLGKISRARFPHEILNNPFDFGAVLHTHTHMLINLKSSFPSSTSPPRSII